MHGAPRCAAMPRCGHMAAEGWIEGAAAPAARTRNQACLSASELLLLGGVSVRGPEGSSSVVAWRSNARGHHERQSGGVLCGSKEGAGRSRATATTRARKATASRLPAEGAVCRLSAVCLCVCVDRLSVGCVLAATGCGRPATAGGPDGRARAGCARQRGDATSSVGSRQWSPST